MRSFTTLEAIAVPYLEANVDTDLIIRAERCVYAKREELGFYAFEAIRYLSVEKDAPRGVENSACIFNQSPFRDAQILLGGPNFGCGSSREPAVRALDSMGIRCVIAPSFGEIFAGNCLQNGIPVIRLPIEAVERLGREILAHPDQARLRVDLHAQTVIDASGGSIAFEFDPLRKRMLLEGLDEIAMTLTLSDKIEAFQRADRARRPWIYLDRPS